MAKKPFVIKHAFILQWFHTVMVSAFVYALVRSEILRDEWFLVAVIIIFSVIIAAYTSYWVVKSVQVEFEEREQKLSDLAVVLFELSQNIDSTVKQIGKKAVLVGKCAERMNELAMSVDLAAEQEQSPGCAREEADIAGASAKVFVLKQKDQ